VKRRSIARTLSRLGVKRLLFADGERLSADQAWPSWRPTGRTAPFTEPIGLQGDASLRVQQFLGHGVAVFTLFALGLPASAAECRAAVAQLRQEVLQVHDKQKNIGAQAAIWLDGRIVWSEAFGMADLEAKRPVTRTTPFAIASIAKGVTGLAYLKAEGAWRIDPDAPITRYVPEFRVSGAKAVTPRLLVRHHAGVPHWQGGPADRMPFYSMHLDDVSELAPLWRDTELEGKPGEKYLYSSPGYNILALAVQRATGTEFKAYVEREVLKPLGLTHTRFDDVRSRSGATAKRYTWKHPLHYYGFPAPERVPEWDYSHNMAGGNMLSTAEDLVRLGAALQRPGYLTEAELAKIGARPTLPDGSTSPYAYGWSIAKADSERMLSMTGANAGVQAGVFSYPERKLVVAMLSNAWGIGSESGELVIDLPKRLADLCARPAGASGAAARGGAALA